MGSALSPAEKRINLKPSHRTREPAMRLALVLSAFAIAMFVSAAPPSIANAQGCTGPDCAKQSQPGGHQCERERKEDVTS